MAVKPLRKAHDEDRMDLSCMSHTECSLEEMNLQPGDELVLESLLKLGSVDLRTLGLEMTIASSDLEGDVPLDSGLRSQVGRFHSRFSIAFGYGSCGPRPANLESIGTGPKPSRRSEVLESDVSLSLLDEPRRLHLSGFGSVFI